MSSGKGDAQEYFERMVSLAKGDKGDKGERGQRGVGMTRGTRRAIVVLFVLMVALAGANLLFTAHEVTANDRKFCDVIHGFVATPVQRPADPKANPARETSYEWYERFVRLGQSLGC